MGEVPEYEQLELTLRDLEREVKRFETLQKKQQKLQKSIREASGASSGDSATLTPKHLSELKKVYADLVECCQKTHDAAQSARQALEPLQQWQTAAAEAEETERKRVRLSLGGGMKDLPLPVWIGSPTGHVAPPPLCGKVSFPPDGRIVPGDLVAANEAAVRKEAPNWILCKVESYSGAKNNKYMVSDVAPEEGTVAVPFELPRKQIVPLPKTVPKIWDSRTEFAKGDHVMALFPGTTSFYNAIVMDVPSSKNGSYLLQFDDDEDEHGETPFREIKPAFVVESQNAQGSKKR